jgi:thymidylate synthase
MNKLDDQYLDLLRKILRDGKIKTDRTGTGTQSIFGYQIRHNMADGFPLLTSKKVHFKGIITELLWFLRGDTNIRYLVENGCNIWNGDAYKKFKLALEETASPACSPEKFTELIKTDSEFANQWGELGPIYGKQWRNWVSVAWKNGKYRQIPDSVHNRYDQIGALIKDLKKNPDSRRLMVNAWNVGEIDRMTLPPCHYGFQCYTTELTQEERFDWYFVNKRPNRDCVDAYDELCVEDREDFLNNSNAPKRTLSLMWNQRSVDTPLGLPFNIASYGLLLMILAKHVNMIPDQLIGNLGDTHIYLNQMDGVKEQLTRPSFALPKLIINNRDVSDISEFQIDDFELFNYVSGPKINFPLSN